MISALVGRGKRIQLERQKQEDQGIPGRIYSENTVLTRKVKKKKN